MKENKWSKIPNKKLIEETINSLREKGINVILVNNKEEALEKIKELIPAGSEIITGSSTTLDEMGFMDFLKSGKHKWKNLYEEIKKESDSIKRAELRRKASASEYFLGSVNAIVKTGELIACDASGSRVGAYPFSAGKLILVSGVQKITDSFKEGIKRVREYVYPLENERAKKVYGMPSTFGKWVIIEREIFKDRITLILIKEGVGYWDEIKNNKKGGT